MTFRSTITITKLTEARTHTEFFPLCKSGPESAKTKERIAKSRLAVIFLVRTKPSISQEFCLPSKEKTKSESCCYPLAHPTSTHREFPQPAKCPCRSTGNTSGKCTQSTSSTYPYPAVSAIASYPTLPSIVN